MDIAGAAEQASATVNHRSAVSGGDDRLNAASVARNAIPAHAVAQQGW